MNIALILSGGTGTRLGSNIPKQYIEVNGRMIISYCLELFCEHSDIDKIQIVAEREWQEEILKEVEKYDTKHKFCGFSAPGEMRQSSILYGLSDIRKYANDSDYILIHDAVRPLLSSEIVSDCFDAVKGHDGVVPVLAVKDMIYFSEEGKTIDSLLNRNKMYVGQNPEVFQLGKYYRATIELLPGEIFNINSSTEVAIMAGMDVVMVPGEEKNLKIRTQADLERFISIIEKKCKRIKTDRLVSKASFCYTGCSSIKGGFSFDRKKQTRTLATTHFGLGAKWDGNSSLVFQEPY